MLSKQILTIKYISLLFLMVLVTGSAETFAQTRRPVLRKRTTVRRTTVVPTSARLFSLPAGTRFRARINESLNSKTARIGQTFTADVTEPVYSSTGAVLVPQGSVLTGRVDSVIPAAKGGKPGSIDVSFRRLRIPNGTSRVINGTMTDLVADDAKTNNEGTVSGDRMRHRKLIFIGGGGAGGAVLGAAIGGGRGALIGGLLGAGGGYLGQKLTKGEEAEVRVGTEFGVYLNQPISLPKFAEVNP
jgi:hypothetical protein